MSRVEYSLIIPVVLSLFILFYLESLVPFENNVFVNAVETNLDNIAYFFNPSIPFAMVKMNYPLEWDKFYLNGGNMTLFVSPVKTSGVVVLIAPRSELFMSESSNDNLLREMSKRLENFNIIGENLTNLSSDSNIRNLHFGFSDKSYPNKGLLVSGTDKDITIIFLYYSNDADYNRFLPEALVMLESIQVPKLINIFSKKNASDLTIELRNETMAGITSDNHQSNASSNKISNGNQNISEDSSPFFKNFKSESIGITIRYPESFSLSEQYNRAIFTSPENKADVIVANLPSFNKESNKITSEKVKSLENLANLQVINIDQSDIFGVQTQMILYEYTDTGETKKFKTLELWKLEGNLVHSFKFSAEMGVYDYYLPIVIEMLNSLSWDTGQ